MEICSELERESLSKSFMHDIAQSEYYLLPILLPSTPWCHEAVTVGGPVLTSVYGVWSYLAMCMVACFHISSGVLGW